MLSRKFQVAAYILAAGLLVTGCSKKKDAPGENTPVAASPTTVVSDVNAQGVWKLETRQEIKEDGTLGEETTEANSHYYRFSDNGTVGYYIKGVNEDRAESRSSGKYSVKGNTISLDVSFLTKLPMGPSWYMQHSVFALQASIDGNDVLTLRGEREIQKYSRVALMLARKVLPDNSLSESEEKIAQAQEDATNLVIETAKNLYVNIKDYAGRLLQRNTAPRCSAEENVGPALSADQDPCDDETSTQGSEEGQTETPSHDGAEQSTSEQPADPNNFFALPGFPF